MRQTSRAVALLLTLESAQAATITAPAATQTWLAANNQMDFTTQFSAQVSTSNAGQNRQAVFNPNANLPSGNTWAGISANTSTTLAANNTAGTPTSTTAGSKCVPCIASGGVWCSRTYAYTSTSTLQGQTASGAALANTQGMAPYPNGATTATSTTDANMLGGAAFDGGSCCATTTTDFNTKTGQGAVGLTGTFATATGLTTGYVQQACVAMRSVAFTNDAAAATVAAVGFDALSAGATKYTNWWCSNGLYKKVTAATDATVNITQPIMANQNPRTELAFAACPQITATCGTTNGAVVKSFTDTTTAAVTVLLLAANGLTQMDKCTWVATSAKAAPTFTIANGTGASTLGLATLNWQLHSMEYTAEANTNSGSLIPNGTSGTGFQTASMGLSLGSQIPMFDMPNAQFNTLRTWYGKGAATTNADQTEWLAPYQNSVTRAQSAAIAGVNTQQMGNVANFPSSTANSGTTAGTGDFGKVTVGGASVYYDVRVVRYFPAQVAAASWAAGNSLYGTAGTYASAVTAYNTAKTNWDAYVAILAKNAKADAFAAAFSPPKAPTVPPLPSQPWVPGSYMGYIKQTPKEFSIMVNNAGNAEKTTALQPTNQQFWTSRDAAMTTGGWGTFTAQVLTFRDGFGKSFGTIGYSGDTNKLAKSATWNYIWTCGAAGVEGALCDKTYTTTANTSTVAVGATAINAVPLYIAVTLWSAGIAGTTALNYSAFTVATAKNDFAITFQASAWDGSLITLTALAAPAATTAASSLTGIAGAQALAASAAAALAAAAALY